MKTAAIVLNSPGPVAEILEEHVVCADGGLRHLGERKPDAVIGDLDSLGFVPEGTEVRRYPREKNETDGELAVDYCAERGFGRVVLYGALGGDAGHVFGNAGLLLRAAERGMEALIRERDLTMEAASGSFRKAVRRGERISLVPFGGDALVSSSSGLKYPLTNLLLRAGTGRGLSNVATDEEISLEIGSGRLLVIRYFN